MKKAFEKTLGLFFCLTFLILTALPTAAAAKKTELTAKNVRDKNVNAHPSVQITYSGQSIAGGGLLINETTYIPLRAFVDTLTDAVITYDAKNREATVTDKGLTLLVRDGSHVIYANGRALYSLTPAVVMSDGKMYIPIRTAAKVMGVSVTWSDKTRSVALAGKVSYLISGDLYYNADSLYWLSRIISAEARGEPFAGQIAVGNVVLNRKESSQFPNTVKGVIFDTKYGVQFSPVSSGTIYNTPAASAVMAAKICLEGYSLSTKMLYFYNPTIATSSWIGRTRPYIMTIGNHKFYA